MSRTNSWASPPPPPRCPFPRKPWPRASLRFGNSFSRRSAAILPAAAAAPKPANARIPPKYDPPAELAELQTELDRLQARIAAVGSEEFKAQSAAQTSTEPTPTEAAILNRLQRLEETEIPVQILTPEGKVLDEARYRLGQPLQFRLIPKRE